MSKRAADSTVGGAHSTMVAQSVPMQRLLEEVESLRGQNTPVIIEGEPGSGRRMVARLLCKGMELDDVHITSNACEMSKSDQRSLHSLVRKNPELRVVTLSDPELSAAVRAGLFSKELFSKLAGVTLRVPPLRDRREDIALLLSRFVASMGRTIGRQRMRVSERASELLERYPWPGNVTELKLVARRLVVGAKTDLIRANEVSKVLPRLAERVPASELAFDDVISHRLRQLLSKVKDYPVRSLHEEIISMVERPLLRLVMEHTGNNQVQAAGMLGISRSTLRRKLDELGVVTKRAPLLRAKSNTTAKRHAQSDKKKRQKS